MDMKEEHHEQQLVRRVIPVEETTGPGAESSLNLLVPVLRRWYVVLIVSLVICTIGIPAVWFLIKPAYTATAAIRVAPIIPSILFSDKESEGVMPMYENFVNTQAALIKSDQVLQRVADDLVDKKLKFFENTANPVAMLRNALIDEDIIVTPGRKSELIMITMESPDTTEAVQIVDSFVKAYMAIEVSKETTGGDRNLSILESERKVLEDKLQRQRQAIRQMAEEYGSVVLTSRQEMMLQQLADLRTELTKIQSQKITLEIQKQILDQTGQQNTSPGEMFKMRYEFINANPTFQFLSNNITQREQELAVAKQTMAPTNPELERKAELLEIVKVSLEEKRKELGITFDDLITKELAKDHKGQLANITIELTQITDYEKHLQDTLARENSETIELGHKQLAIQDQQEQLDLTKELYDKVKRRLQQLEMERKRPARISIAYNASVAPVRNKRIKLTAALMFGSLAAGCFLAFLIGKADRSFYAPDDVTRRLGVPIIGTTTDPSYIDTPKLPQQISCDYQTICANLGLLNGDGIPKKLVITSAGIGDGKTTLTINLATSLANAGKKVLLIDGDLRKPDIQQMLNLPKNSTGLQEVLWGKRFERTVQSFSAGFDVLAAGSRNITDASVLLSKRHVGKCLDTFSEEYDHVIIDTPPVLAFPDALLWAKMADGVILASFSGRTTEPDLRKTLERLEQVKVKVLGTIFHNVRNIYSYNRYAYGYHTGHTVRKNNHKKDTKTMLMMPIKEFSKDSKSSKSSRKISDQEKI